MHTLKFTAAALLLALPAALAAPPEAADGVQVAGAWARASAGAAVNGAAYVTLTGGKEADRLVGVSTPIADTTSVHDSIRQGGLMRMVEVPALAIPAGKTVTLSPGGYHIMLIGLHKPLTAGESFPLTLRFDHTPPVTVAVDVKAIGEAAPQTQPAGSMPMDHNHMH